MCLTIIFNFWISILVLFQNGRSLFRFVVLFTFSLEIVDLLTFFTKNHDRLAGRESGKKSVAVVAKLSTN